MLRSVVDVSWVDLSLSQRPEERSKRKKDLGSVKESCMTELAGNQIWGAVLKVAWTPCLVPPLYGSWAWSVCAYALVSAPASLRV